MRNKRKEVFVIKTKEIHLTILLLSCLNLLLQFLILFKLDLDGFHFKKIVLEFSEESGFYQEDIEVAATTLSKNITIYYSLDGSRPDSGDKEHTFVYENPISLEVCDDKIDAIVIKFIGYDEKGHKSDVYTNTYFMGKYVKNRFDTLVISLSTDSDYLYGYENGIFVEGKLRDDYIAEHPDEELKYSAPANYNLRGKESERPVHIEVFESDGMRVISQDGGIRTSGNFTRTSEQKSFKLYARNKYDRQNKFMYPFFMDGYSQVDGVVATSYDCIKARNTGNDRLEAFIRDELAMRLGEQAGMQDIQCVRPVSVFINGAYNGCYWLHSNYDEAYFKNRYGTYKGNMVVIGSGEMEMETDTRDDLSNQYAAEYTEIYNKYSELDLTRDANFKELEKQIDIDNYLQYYAIEILMANQDWPYNNQKAYRYVDAGEGKYQADSIFDGRYRYLLYDVDTSMGHGYIADNIDSGKSFEILQNCLDPEKNYAPLFAALMSREDCRQQFVLNLCDFMNGALSYENVCRTLDAMHQERENEMVAYIRESEENVALTKISDYYTNMQMDCIKAWAKVTPLDMRSKLQELWNLGEQYELTLFLSDDVYAKVNSVSVDEEGFQGVYFTDSKVRITAVVPQGKRFAYWRINGEKYWDQTLEIKPEMIHNGKIYVSLYATDDEKAGLDLYSVCAKGESDYFVIKNNTCHVIDTKGYYVKDKDKPSHVYYLPQALVEPGASIRINCQNCMEDQVPYFMQVGFSLSEGEHLTLGLETNGDLDVVEIPSLGIDGGIYCKDYRTGKWKERGMMVTRSILVDNIDRPYR